MEQSDGIDWRANMVAKTAEISRLRKAIDEDRTFADLPTNLRGSANPILFYKSYINLANPDGG